MASWTSRADHIARGASRLRPSVDRWDPVAQDALLYRRLGQAGLSVPCLHTTAATSAAGAVPGAPCWLGTVRSRGPAPFSLGRRGLPAALPIAPPLPLVLCRRALLPGRWRGLAGFCAARRPGYRPGHGSLLVVLLLCLCFARHVSTCGRFGSRTWTLCSCGLWQPRTRVPRGDELAYLGLRVRTSGPQAHRRAPGLSPGLAPCPFHCGRFGSSGGLGSFGAQTTYGGRWPAYAGIEGGGSCTRHRNTVWHRAPNMLSSHCAEKFVRIPRSPLFPPPSPIAAPAPQPPQPHPGYSRPPPPTAAPLTLPAPGAAAPQRPRSFFDLNIRLLISEY